MGLCEELGDDAVVDFPYKKSFHNQVDTYPSWYPHVPPGTVGTTAPFDWMRPSSGRPWSKEEVVDRIGEFDLCVLAAPRRYNVPALRDLVATVGHARMPPIVLVDGEDYDRLHTELVSEFGLRVYFKRELLPGAGCGCRLEPFSFASPVKLPFPPQDKDLGVVFLGGGTSPDRATLCEALRAAFGDRFTGGVGPHVTHRQYLETMARARVAVSVRGWGMDTLKFYEIPSLPGTMLAADRQPLVRAHPFEDGVHAGWFSSPEELVAVARRALEDEPWRSRVAAAGNEHLMRHHTPRARARQLLEISLS